MGEQTKIAWCDDTFNFGIGCEPAMMPNGKPHPGCVHCYAKAKNEYRGWVRDSTGDPAWGPWAPRKVTSDDNWKNPLRWARAAAKARQRRKVFCASLADVLEPKWPPEVLARLWDLIRKTHLVAESGRRVTAFQALCAASGSRIGGLDWLILTKRPERWAVIPEDVRPLVWLGTSVSDQATADEWIPRLLGAQGFALRFLSVEPLVGPVDLERWLWMAGPSSAGLFVDGLGRPRGGGGCGGQTVTCRPTRDIAWVIVGGESGPKARPCDVAWIRAIVGQCRAAGVPPFVKQLGARPYMERWNEERQDHETCWLDPEDSHGGDPSEWPEPFPREFPEVSRG